MNELERDTDYVIGELVAFQIRRSACVRIFFAFTTFECHDDRIHTDTHAHIYFVWCQLGIWNEKKKIYENYSEFQMKCKPKTNQKNIWKSMKRNNFIIVVSSFLPRLSLSLWRRMFLNKNADFEFNETTRNKLMKSLALRRKSSVSEWLNEWRWSVCVCIWGRMGADGWARAVVLWSRWIFHSN